jgi:hypothetical protein
MCESRGQFGSSDKPRVVPWAQSVISKWTGFSRIAAAVLLPRRLLICIDLSIASVNVFSGMAACW